MNKIAMYALLGIFALSLFSNTAVSTSWAPEAFEIPYQVNHSDRIVIGTVKELRQGFESTDVVISVDEWLKNPLPSAEKGKFSMPFMELGKRPASDRDAVVKEIEALPKSTSPIAMPQTPGFEAVFAAVLLLSIYMLKRGSTDG